MTPQWLAAIEGCLWPKGDRRDIWMIVDAARDRRIFPMLLNLCLEYSCLLSGPLAPVLELAAPYLVQLEFDDKNTRSLIRQGWGNSWGVFLKCDERLDTLRRHLRGFLQVRDPRGGRLYFRYYDPRVLRLYLPTCNAEELGAVFGPIERFWMEDEAPGTMLAFDFARGQVARKQLFLDGAER